MDYDFFIVSKSVLPDCFEKVVEARELLRSGRTRDVSEAARMVGISRSTYYKYKDHVFLPKEGEHGRRLVVSMLLSHKRGTLGRVLSELGELGANIVTINQNPPIGDRASVMISMDIASMSSDTQTLLARLRSMDGVDDPVIIDMA
ncbi:MAG: ACT domain-containing protein [Firmicutes bacterium]|jgi:chorismate mutase|nr:ACT domain-containing protein [Bacillota bacterium]MBR6351276.1 ACT domain-containing protein [Bacillota bacterium]